MDWIENWQLFLFDFDGLLVDTEPLHYAAYMEMARLRGCPLNWDFQRFCLEAHSREMGFFHGMQREYPDAFGRGTSREELYAEKKKIYLDMLAGNRLQYMEGALPLIETVTERRKKCAVVTNSPRAHIDIVQKLLPDLRKIPLWLTREDYMTPKPSPEGYLKAIHTLGTPGDRIIGFEDTIKGLKSLVAAGAESVLVCPADPERIEEARRLGARHCSSLLSVSASIPHFNKI